MDDQAFDKSLSDKLSALDEYVPRESDWQSVQGRLHRRRSLVDGYWWGALLLLLLLGTNGWLGYQWHRTQQQYDTLRSKVDQLQPVLTASVSDTVYQRVVVHHYDTVYRMVVLRESLASNASKEREALTDRDPDLENETISTGSPLTFDDTISNRMPEDFLIATDSADLLRPEKGQADSNLMKQPFDSLLITTTGSLADSSALTSRESDGTIEKSRFRLGFGVQLSQPMHPGIDQQVGVGGGVSGSWLFTRRLGLVAQVHYLRTGYALMTPDESLGVADILSGSVYQNDELQEVQNRQSQLQWSGGGQYRFAAGRKWTPLIALHYVVETPLRRTLTYSLRDANTNKVYVEERTGPLPTFRHIIDGELGIERNLTYRSMWQITGFYNTQLTTQRQVRPNQIGLRARIYYEFK